MSLPLLLLNKDKKPLSWIVFENLSIFSCEAGLKSLLVKGLNSIKGIYLQADSLDKETRQIYTSTGSPILKEGEVFNGECIKLNE